MPRGISRLGLLTRTTEDLHAPEKAAAFRYLQIFTDICRAAGDQRDRNFATDLGISGLRWTWCLRVDARRLT